MTPVEEEMKFGRFLDILQKREEAKGTYYYQHQNNSLREQLTPLVEDVEEEGPKFAREAFGCPPDAVNFWMGDDRAVSSMHADPYEVGAAAAHGMLKPLL